MGKKKIEAKMKKVLVFLAQKAACAEANTACSLWYYQPSIPECVKKLRKF